LDRPELLTYNHSVRYSGRVGATAPVISERERRPGGCCVPLVEPDLSAEDAPRLAVLAKALADPTRLRIVDTVRKASPEAVCQCELLPLFEMSQPALSKHLRILVTAGVLGTERRGLWAYYFEMHDGLKELTTWLS
jgi:ArsR family transcriptional regulator, arsenate/arsenite/antimonite-responsive transcriptional repressor